MNLTLKSTGNVAQNIMNKLIRLILLKSFNVPTDIKARYSMPEH